MIHSVHRRPVRDAPDQHAVPEAALAARYRQRRVFLLVALVAVTFLPIVALGAWWLWPLLVVPAVLAAPMAGGTGLIATLLAAAIGMAAASAGGVSAAEVTVGFAAIIVVSALGTVHAGMGMGTAAASEGARPPELAPRDVFEIIADRDCRRAAETGAPVSLTIVGIPRLDTVATEHGRATAADLLAAARTAAARATSATDLVVGTDDGRFHALVSGTAEDARETGERIALAIEAVSIRTAAGIRVPVGAVGVGAAQWAEGDGGLPRLAERAERDLLFDMVSGVDGTRAHMDERVTGEFRPVAIPDAA